MKAWTMMWVLGLAFALVTQAMAEEEGGRDRRSPIGDRTPVTAPEPVPEEETEAPETDRTPMLMPETVEEERVEAPEREALTMEERVEELEYLVDRHTRMLDPYNHRDEMRLENRLRALERTMETVEQELRRLQQQLRNVELRR